MQILKMTVRSKVAVALIASFSLFAPVAHALQMVDVGDQRSHVVKISQREMSRIAVENEKITKMDFIDGELDVKQDKDNGYYLVLPNVAKPINVFVTTSSNKTHALILQPTDMPLETVILQEQKTNPKFKQGTQNLEKAGSLENAIREFIVAMARGEVPFQYEIRELNNEITLWEEARFVITKRYTGPSYIGETYLLINTSKKPMRIAEQELYREGVQAISIEQQILNPGETTNVFIVRVSNDG